jgi:hypothetical protein
VTEITYEQWAAELAKLSSEARVEGITVAEIVAQTGESRRAVLARLQAGKAAGMVRPVRVYREAVDGTRRVVPGYVLLSPKVTQ